MRRDSRGQALVEFALVLPVLILVLTGVFDLARVVSISSTLDSAVREGTRYAIVHGEMSTSPAGPGTATYTAPDRDSTVEAVVRNAAVATPSDLAVRVTWPDGNNRRNSRVIVTATASYTPILSAAILGGGLRVPLSASSRLPIQN